jgi:hypothetical protein
LGITLHIGQIKSSIGNYITYWTKKKFYWELHYILGKEKVILGITLHIGQRKSSIGNYITYWTKKKFYWELHYILDKEKVLLGITLHIGQRKREHVCHDWFKNKLLILQSFARFP